MPSLDADIPPHVLAKLDELTGRVEALDQELANPDVLADHEKVRELSTQRAAIQPVAALYNEFKNAWNEAAELETALEGDDAELAEMAREELPKLHEKASALIETILADLVTTDDRAVASVILEVRAGVGGDEAALWAGELFAMYQRYAASRAWTFEAMDFAESEVGGAKHASATITGEGAWAELAHEAGVHCVKRVPATEAQGRVHTSTATVAALPEPSAVQLDINPADVDEHITTSQGPGGQNVNKVATAVHLIHKPTGVEVRMQETKSQRQNREKAWRLLRARLYELELEKQRQERAEQRSSQIGAGDRSERIRTYRFKDGFAVDHRLGENFNLDKLLSGALDDLVAALTRREIERRLAEL